MINFIKSLFSTDPRRKIRIARDRLYKSAVEYQRNGKLREYAAAMKEIELLEIEYENISAEMENRQ